ncbi:hypothetical protein BJV78DRAFT_1244253 [Lactifluus subvellereus]|nr:hypothetical protein BJV78DRAFT_1244253 [Lactifluus subvellereus]
MEHILIHCNATPTRAIWELARTTWPHDHRLWPDTTIGIILGCGSIVAPDRDPHPRRPDQPQERSPKGAMRLLQILLSESAYLIWVLRCEREIQKRTQPITEVNNRWHHAINARLTDDKILATKIKRDKKSTQTVKNTWEHVFRKDADLPDDWITSREVLVGRRTRHTLPPY